MARIQILELPAERHGDATTTPFLLIVDQVEDTERLRQDMNGAKEASGARGILAFQESIDIPAAEAERGPQIQYHLQPPHGYAPREQANAARTH